MAGVARDAHGVIGTLPLAAPILINMGGSGVLHNMSRSIDAAVDAGAEIVSISAGLPCEPLGAFGLGIDFCDPLGRIAVVGICLVIDVFLGHVLTPLPLLLPSLVPLLDDLVGAASVRCTSLVIKLMRVAGATGRDNLQDSLDRAADAGVLVVVSGTEPIDIGGVGPTEATATDFVPCVLRNAFCVGLADLHSRTADTDKNTFATAIDLWVHDRNRVHFPGGGEFHTGTSASAPNAAGAAAMIIAASGGRLNGVQAGRILQDTSLGLTAPLSGTCVTRPTAGGCVGKMDIHAAVIAAAGADAPTCMSVEPANPNDTGDSATELGELLIGTSPGEVRVTEYSTDDMAIHALPADQDYYRIDPPEAGQGSDLRGATRVELLVDERYGDLEMEVFQGQVANVANDYDLDWDEPFYVAVTSAGNAPIDDTCYSLRISTKIDPSPDFAQRNSSGSPAATWQAPFVASNHDYDCAALPCQATLRWVSTADMSQQVGRVPDLVSLPIPNLVGEAPSELGLDSFCSTTRITDPSGRGLETYYNVNTTLRATVLEAVNPLSASAADLDVIPISSDPVGAQDGRSIELNCRDLAGLDTWEVEVGTIDFIGFAIGGYTLQFEYEVNTEIFSEDQLLVHPIPACDGGLDIPDLGNPTILPNPNGGGGDICELLDSIPDLDPILPDDLDVGGPIDGPILPELPPELVNPGPDPDF